jgi:hypothetical protein
VHDGLAVDAAALNLVQGKEPKAPCVGPDRRHDLQICRR